MVQGLETVIDRFSVGSVYVTDDTSSAISERLKLHDLPVAIVQPSAAAPSSRVPEGPSANAGERDGRRPRRAVVDAARRERRQLSSATVTTGGVDRSPSRWPSR
jgi:hypothetical protein